MAVPVVCCLDQDAEIPLLVQFRSSLVDNTVPVRDGVFYLSIRKTVSGIAEDTSLYGHRISGEVFHSVRGK